MINREKFYKDFPFRPLNQSQVNGYNFLLSKLESDDYPLIQYPSEMAYVLATTRHETNDTEQPEVEGFYLHTNRTQKLYNYYSKYNWGALRTIFPNGINQPTYEGRGFVQVTHNFNYTKFNPFVKKKFPDYDIVKNPELALIPEVAWIIMYEGMTRDTLTFNDANFTGHTLEEFLGNGKKDYYGARRIVNGKDKASLIASYAEQFEKIIEFV